MVRLRHVLLTIFSLMVGCICGAASAQVSTPGAIASRTILNAGDVLAVDYRYFSPNGKYFLLYQYDGNLVVYKVVGSGQPTNSNTVIWSSKTDKRNATQAIFQTDGNLVISSGTTLLWASNTGGSAPGYTPRVVMMDNGSFQVGGGSGLVFTSTSDPLAAPPPSNCQTLQQYPVCSFPGTPYQFNGWVLACSIADAEYQAYVSGAVYGRCPGT